MTNLHNQYSCPESKFFVWCLHHLLFALNKVREYKPWEHFSKKQSLRQNASVAKAEHVKKECNRAFAYLSHAIRSQVYKQGGNQLSRCLSGHRAWRGTGRGCFQLPRPHLVGPKVKKLTLTSFTLIHPPCALVFNPPPQNKWHSD